jgi:predicted dehydrogenase
LDEVVVMTGSTLHRPIRIAVLGAGSISNYHISGLKAAGAEVVAVFSRSEEKARAQAARHGVPLATADWRGLVARADVDAVVIATPDFTHEELAVAVARAGKPMLLQKPMARTAAECQRILATVERTGTPLYVSFMHRYFPEVEAVRRLLEAKALGSLTMIRQRNATPGADWAQWFYRKDLVGGGAVMQIGIHGIDLLQYLFGRITAVRATTAITLPRRMLADGTVIEPDNEDMAICIYRFDNGLTATHEVSYTEIAGTDRFRLEIYGTAGTAWLRSEFGSLAVNHGVGWATMEVPNEEVGYRQHRHWLAMLAGHEQPDSSAQDGLSAVLVAEAVYRSAGKSDWETIFQKNEAS